ncbi:glutaredoxin family protein [Brevibacterium album]|uniref:glutaredoxin family protein n=1 Tax=Brevibacterium album TaxID=417948 RepID=UPI00041EB050|nr:glutaredoxin family protein [Brevibacterium album]
MDNYEPPKGAVVYVKPDCPQCVATKRWMDRAGVRYTAVDLTEDAEAYRFVTGHLGYAQAPVVLDGDGAHWSGFRIDLLEQSFQ